MKRGANEDHHRTLMKAFKPNGWKFFVVVRGRQIGFFSTYEDVKPLVYGCDGVYKSFSRRQEAEAWFEKALQLPLNPHATEIHISSRHYDLTQDKDWVEGVSIYFGRGNKLNFCAPKHLGNLKVFIKAIERAPKDVPLRIITDSKTLAFGFNYGMKSWPKHEFIVSAETQSTWDRINALVGSRIVAIDYSKEQNSAYEFARTKMLPP